jgi:hypothetical protein
MAGCDLSKYRELQQESKEPAPKVSPACEFRRRHQKTLLTLLSYPVMSHLGLKPLGNTSRR